MGRAGKFHSSSKSREISESWSCPALNSGRTLLDPSSHSEVTQLIYRPPPQGASQGHPHGVLEDSVL